MIRALPIPRRGTGPKWAGPFALVAGLALLAGWAGALALGEWRQSAAESRWERVLGRVPEHPGSGPPPPGVARPVDGVDFRLRVPRIGYRAVVHEGVTDEVLFGGPGHYPDTSWPGQPGTVGLAAHNVYWLRFGQLRAGDEVVLDTRYGTYRYRITDIRVVAADDRSALAGDPGRRLVMTTCWPLWAGQLATRRLAVYAR